MPFRPSDLSKLSAADFDALVVGGERESQTLEFKSKPYSDGPDGGREFLKDISAFANTDGGTLIVGLADQEGTATDLSPITTPDADKFQLRLQSLLRSSIEPTVFGIQMQAVLIEGGYILVVTVPPSTNPPHRVSAQGSNRFYVRHSAGVSEATLTELRSLFSQSQLSSDRLESLRFRRLTEISNGNTIDLVDRADRLVLHIAPLSVGLGQRIDVTKAHENQSLFSPIESSGYSPVFNADGFANVRGGALSHGYTQIFREGWLEAVEVGVLGGENGTSVVPARWLDDKLIVWIEQYLRGLLIIGSNPPWAVMISLMGVGGARVVVGERAYFSSDVRPLKVSNLRLPTCVVQELGTRFDLEDALRPALDALWNAAGLSRWSASKVRT